MIHVRSQQAAIYREDEPHRVWRCHRYHLIAQLHESRAKMVLRNCATVSLSQDLSLLWRREAIKRNYRMSFGELRDAAGNFSPQSAHLLLVLMDVTYN